MWLNVEGAKGTTYSGNGYNESRPSTPKMIHYHIDSSSDTPIMVDLDSVNAKSIHYQIGPL